MRYETEEETFAPYNVDEDLPGFFREHKSPHVLELFTLDDEHLADKLRELELSTDTTPTLIEDLRKYDSPIFIASSKGRLLIVNDCSSELAFLRGECYRIEHNIDAFVFWELDTPKRFDRDNEFVYRNRKKIGDLLSELIAPRPNITPFRPEPIVTPSENFFTVTDPQGRIVAQQATVMGNGLIENVTQAPQEERNPANDILNAVFDLINQGYDTNEICDALEGEIQDRERRRHSENNITPNLR